MHMCPDLVQLHAGTVAAREWASVASGEAAVRLGGAQSLLRVTAFQHLLRSFADPENGMCQCARS